MHITRVRLLRAYLHPKYLGLLCISIALLLGFSAQASAQEIHQPVRVGIGFGFGDNISSTNIESFAGSILCGVYRQGHATGSSFFAAADVPLSDLFSLMPTLGYYDISSAFTTIPFNIEHARDLNTFDTIPISRQRNFTTSVQAVSLSLLAAFKPLSRFHIGIGGSVSLLTRHSYNETEKLLTSSIVYRDNNLSTHAVNDGTFDANKILVAIDFSSGYSLSLSPTIEVTPQVRASIPLNPITSTNGWNFRTWTIGGAVTMMYSLPSNPPMIEPKPRIEPLPPPILVEAKKEISQPPKSILRVSMKAVGVTETGEEVAEPVVSIENVRVTDLAPTLNYLFFDDGSSEIPSRYHLYSSEQESRSFNETLLYKSDALGIHHDVLNILGSRLRAKPTTKITITGTRSLHSSGDSSSVTDIAFLRAEHTSKYLQDVWGIAPSRIKMKSRALPEQPSDDNVATGQAENRRIEISTNSVSLLEPLETHKLQRIATPPEISFISNITADAGIRSQTITIKQSGKIIKTLDALSGSSNGELNWNIAESEMTEGNDSVTWQSDLVDSLGQTATTSGVIRVKKEIHNKTQHVNDSTADKSLERYHLLLFDYSSASALGSVSDDIFDRIASAITPDARVSLIGHTDITGDANYNEHLSFDRATSASQKLSARLRKLGKSAPTMSLQARGAKDILFDNSNAEGRFLSRTVRVTIERDLNK
ncbi:MAG: OmpA family protein [bacterium]